MSTINAKGLVLKNSCFTPQRGASLSEKLADCYHQFVLSSANNSKHSVIKQTVFISANSQTEYYQNKEKIFTYAKLFFGGLPPTSVIAQLREADALMLEIVYLEGLNEGELLLKENHLGSWLVVEHDQMKMVIASNLGQQSGEGSILEQSIEAFEQLQSILQEEKMDFSDIIRQWNYIEQITDTVAHKGTMNQHYQIFNDVRSKYYEQAVFKNGFPAATGIGMDFGGIILDFMAAKFKDDHSVIGLKNPVQIDAYSYSSQVLGLNLLLSDFCQTTPKFERAKVVMAPGCKWIFVSGTAAITGEASVANSTIEFQTDCTLDNILSLIAGENLLNHGVRDVNEVKIESLRAYVKHKNHIQPVMKICQKRFPGVSIAFVVADVCRPELLVEIEGIAIIR